MSGAIVKKVIENSIAWECGIVPGDVILSINDKEFTDVLDFRFLTSDDYYVAEVLKTDGSTEKIEIYNDLYEQFGCEFENELMDTPKTCRNKCIFCFMDQLPPNMRETMYFKDDDVRLSFLQGNYVTLTNLSDSDIDRICKLRISPVNISVHATEPELRCMMLNNRFAGDVMKIMHRFSENEIYMNAQIVLCKGINDSKHLDRSIEDLKTLFPYIRSISVVPVGITAYREGLYPLESYDAASSADVIRQLEKLQNKYLKELGTRLVYIADEFYIKSGSELPGYDTYEDFPQIENGVGLMAALKKEVSDVLSGKKLKGTFKSKSIATSEIAYDYICKLTDQIKAVYPKTKINVYKIKNRFFGGKITVTGLICGCDIIEQLSGAELGEYLVLSQSMFKSDCDIMLDNTTKEELEKKLNVKVIINDNTGEDFVASLIM